VRCRVRRAACTPVLGPAVQTLPIRAAVADVVVVDPPPLVCLWGVLQRRCRYRGGQHPDGTFDRIAIDFLRYVIRYRRRHLPRTLARMAEHGPYAMVVPLTSRRQIDGFVARLTRRPAPGATAGQAALF
jgi:hypothetical protein